MPRARNASPPKQLTAFQRRLLAWFHRRKRDLPWRRTSDPYRIWVSEIMLQQTRVAAVVPYYERFLRRFPTVLALARAKPNEVLRLWAGLGYYSRARNLHAAAKQIVTQLSGKFPRDLDAAFALPGIGRYTAAAVLSIAYDVPLAVLDGNVARVLARLGAIGGDLHEPARWRELQETAQRLLPACAPGDWNQAMMELGATVCTPRTPDCGECPLANRCEARRRGLQEEIPAARKKRAPVKVKLAAAVLLDSQMRTLLVRPAERHGGEENAIFSRMWQFPAVKFTRRAETELRARLASEYGVEVDGAHALPYARHSVTFREVTILPYLIRVDALPPIVRSLNGKPPKLRRTRLDRLTSFAISNATRKIADAAFRALSVQRRT